MHAVQLGRRGAGEWRDAGEVGEAAAAEADPAQHLVPATLTSLTSSGSVGAPGFVTTPFGPENQRGA